MTSWVSGLSSPEIILLCDFTMSNKKCFIISSNFKMGFLLLAATIILIDKMLYIKLFHYMFIEASYYMFSEKKKQKTKKNIEHRLLFPFMWPHLPLLNRGSHP